ncbi:MAG: aminomethyl-transferring glycine dehydrogenase subunit GcvPA [bacterium]|nr:aminomethyl-transferring glycine dehydrogenase subunit GcvPA [bacterium]
MRGFVPHTEDEIRTMLAAIGVAGIDDLFATVPADCRLAAGLDMPDGLDEYGTASHIEGLAAANRPAGGELCFLGGGTYDRVIPAVGSQILSRPEFYSAYTPYQPEVSQGTLQMIFEFQTLLARLTGMDVANASLYDGASALAEAVILACGAKRRKKVLLPGSLRAAGRRVVETYTRGMDLELVEIPWDGTGRIDSAALSEQLGDDVAAVVVQTPNYFGVVESLADLAVEIQAAGALVIACVEPTSLALLESPGAQGADIVVGEGQSIGIPMSFGGPGLGLMAVSQKLVRKIPGRIVGRTVDNQGRTGYVLTLQTREQHIRREKATSNICTNQGLMALAATVYLATLGESGLKTLARGLADRAGYLADKIEALPGFSLPFSGDIYQELVITAPISAEEIRAQGAAEGIHAGLALGGDYPLLGDNALLVTVSEKHSIEDLDRFVAFLGRCTS